jgi:hypothetical protein
MTPKEKAEELTLRYYKLGEHLYMPISFAKQCALIAADLHLEELSKMKLIFSDRELHYKYWQEVKQEIEKL